VELPRSSGLLEQKRRSRRAKIARNPFNTEMKIENSIQVTHMLFKIKNKETIFKIILESDKVTKVLRYDRSICKEDIKIIE
jgi:hypothetical protein